MLIYRNKYDLKRKAGSLNTIMMERANEGHGEHRASREAGHGTHWGREAVELDPDRIDGEVIAEGRGASRLTTRQRRLNFFLFMRRNRPDGFFFSKIIFHDFL